MLYMSGAGNTVSKAESIMCKEGFMKYSSKHTTEI